MPGPFSPMSTALLQRFGAHLGFKMLFKDQKESVHPVDKTAIFPSTSRNDWLVFSALFFKAYCQAQWHWELVYCCTKSPNFTTKLITESLDNPSISFGFNFSCIIKVKGRAATLLGWEYDLDGIICMKILSKKYRDCKLLFACFGDIPGSTLRLLLALCFRVIPDC